MHFNLGREKYFNADNAIENDRIQVLPSEFVIIRFPFFDLSGSSLQVELVDLLKSIYKSNGIKQVPRPVRANQKISVHVVEVE